MADLLGLSGEGPPKARWASLTPKSQVWANKANAQVFCRGLLCPPLAKETYTSPSEALLDNAAKNLVMEPWDFWWLSINRREDSWLIGYRFSHHFLFSSLPLRKSYEIRLEEFRRRDPSCGYR
ncbi:hypothetical protein BHE74_00024557 [Ensete ventricosum]|nr:hypothetical protein BHE74_00024557 [Ensete ventricosum]